MAVFALLWTFFRMQRSKGGNLKKARKRSKNLVFIFIVKLNLIVGSNYYFLCCDDYKGSFYSVFLFYSLDSLKADPIDIEVSILDKFDTTQLEL